MAAFLNACRFNPVAGGTTDWSFSSPVPGYQTPVTAGAVNGRAYKYRAESADLSQWELGEGAYDGGTGTFARTVVLLNSSGTTSKIDFSTVPQVAIVALKEDLIAIEEANSFTETQKAQARNNIAAAQLAAMADHNVAINPATEVSQEFGGSGVVLVNNTAKYILDGWEASYNHAAATASLTSMRHAFVGIPGFTFGHRITAHTAITSPASGDFAKHRQKIEGYRIARWGWGAAGAAPIVVAFHIYSVASGVTFVKLSNNDQSRCYYHEIALASGFNFIAFTVPGDTSGSWQTGSLTGLTFEVFAAGKETTPASSLDAWGITNKVQTTNSTNLFGANNSLTVLFGIYIDMGTQLPVAGEMSGLMRTFDQELFRCRRYWQKSYDYATVPGTATGASIIDVQVPPTTSPLTMNVELVPELRASSTTTVYDSSGNVGKVYKGGVNKTAIVYFSGTKRLSIGTGDASPATELAFHYTADARL